MPVDGANLQGANVRQVVMQADTAALSIRPPPLVDSPVRPLATLGERLQVERNQSVGENLFVQRQEDNQDYYAGDTLNGHGRQEEHHRGRRHASGEEDEDNPDDSLHAEEPWSDLGDPKEAQERLQQALLELPVTRVSEVFRDMDRAMLAGLLYRGCDAAPRRGAVSYQKQSVLVQTALESFRLAVHGALRETMAIGDGKEPATRECARKLISLARQAVRSESPVGRELSAFLDESLLEASRAGGEGALRAVALLTIVDTAISLWRERHNVGTVVPWSML